MTSNTRASRTRSRLSRGTAAIQRARLLFQSKQLYRERNRGTLARRCVSGRRNIEYGCYDPSLLGRIGTAPRTICCGPGISETDFVVMKNIPVTERTHFEFRGEIFNVFNHTQFYNPDGNSSDGSQFGQVTQVKDPRLVQFALKFYF